MLDIKIQTICLKIEDWKSSPVTVTKKKERNNIRTTLINNVLTDFKNRINSMSENEIRFQQPNEIVNIVEKILEFNRQQRRWGLKILTPNQMLNRLPISLAKLKAENNSEKLKNEIRQLLYSLYRSNKKTTVKTVKQLNHTDLDWI